MAAVYRQNLRCLAHESRPSVRRPLRGIIVRNAHVAVPDYANAGGTGDRTGIITVTAANFPDAANGQAARSILVNGDKATNNYWWQGTATAGGYLQFDFATAKVITEAKFFEGNAAHHTAKWQGSNDGTNFTDIGGSFQVGATRALVAGGLYSETQTSMSANTTGYRYYRLTTVSGSVSAAPYIYEFEFKLDDA